MASFAHPESAPDMRPRYIHQPANMPYLRQLYPNVTWPNQVLAVPIPVPCPFHPRGSNPPDYLNPWFLRQQTPIPVTPGGRLVQNVVQNNRALLDARAQDAASGNNEDPQGHTALGNRVRRGGAQTSSAGQVEPVCTSGNVWAQTPSVGPLGFPVFPYPVPAVHPCPPFQLPLPPLAPRCHPGPVPSHLPEASGTGRRELDPARRGRLQALLNMPSVKEIRAARAREQEGIRNGAISVVDLTHGESPPPTKSAHLDFVVWIRPIEFGDGGEIRVPAVDDNEEAGPCCSTSGSEGLRRKERMVVYEETSPGSHCYVPKKE